MIEALLNFDFMRYFNIKLNFVKTVKTVCVSVRECVGLLKHYCSLPRSQKEFKCHGEVFLAARHPMDD